MSPWWRLLIYLVAALLVGGLLSGIDRRISARMQARVGPPGISVETWSAIANNPQWRKDLAPPFPSKLRIGAVAARVARSLWESVVFPLH